MDRWSSGDAYERYVGRWSRPVAAAFLRWLAVPPGARWADVGCGTGALAEAVLRDAAPARVVGVDPAAPFVALAREQVPDPRASFVVGDARRLPVADAAVDVVASALSLNFVPDPVSAVADACRAVRPGGVVAAYVWDYAEGMELMRVFWDVAAELDPAALEVEESLRFPLCRPEPLAAAFAGLAGVEVTGITVPTVFADFDDYWTPFLGGNGPAPVYAMSLAEPRRVALREALRERLPIAVDGSIPLSARAWAVRGRVT